MCMFMHAQYVLFLHAAEKVAAAGAGVYFDDDDDDVDKAFRKQHVASKRKLWLRAAFSCLTRCGLKTRSLSHSHHLSLFFSFSSSLSPSHTLWAALLEPRKRFPIYYPSHINHSSATDADCETEISCPSFCYLLPPPCSPQMMPNVRLNEHFWLNIGLNSAASSPVASRTTLPSPHLRLPLTVSRRMLSLSTTWRAQYTKSTRIQFIDHLIYPAEL